MLNQDYTAVFGNSKIYKKGSQSSFYMMNNYSLFDVRIRAHRNNSLVSGSKSKNSYLIYSHSA